MGPDQLRCWRRLGELLPLLAPLHDVGGQRDTAGHREPRFDDYVMRVLLGLFNPLIDSMRSLPRVCDLDEVAQRLGVRRFSLGSFSESVRRFDPARLREVIAQLAGQVNVLEHDRQLAEFTPMLTAVDDRLIHSLWTLASAWSAQFIGESADPNAWRLPARFDVPRGVPTDLQLTEAVNSGQSDEKNVLRRRLEPGHGYIMDRWYGQFTLFNDIRAWSVTSPDWKNWPAEPPEFHRPARRPPRCCAALAAGHPVRPHCRRLDGPCPRSARTCNRRAERD